MTEITKITKKVTSYEAAVALVVLTEKEIKSNEAFIKLTTIAKALNEGWVPDWNDWSENKYGFTADTSIV